MPYVLQEKTAQAGTDSYATLLKSKILGRPWASVIVSNSHASYGLKYKILASNDPEGIDGWSELKAEATINGNTVDSAYPIVGSFIWLDIQIKNASSGQAAIGNAWLVAVGQ